VADMCALLLTDLPFSYDTAGDLDRSLAALWRTLRERTTPPFGLRAPEVAAAVHAATATSRGISGRMNKAYPLFLPRAMTGTNTATAESPRG
jgi:hypothetical protein